MLLTTCSDGVALVHGGRWDRGVFRWVDRVELAAHGGDERARIQLGRIVDALNHLRGLNEPPQEDSPSLKRVRQRRRYPVWRVAHPYDPAVAVRVICWFPPARQTAVVALFAADKASMGDVFYDSVGTRADAAIDGWISGTTEEE